MNDMIKNQMKSSDETNVMEERKMMETWPVTKAPKQYTQTPIPSPNTNPPLVLPISQPQPPAPKSERNPPANRDVTAEVGTSPDADFNPDSGEYRLIMVKDKDVPDSTGYNPRAKLKFFPKGYMPGSNEEFYLVTHRFADRAGIAANKRGLVVIKSDSLGVAQSPLRVTKGGAGGLGYYRTSETEEKATGTAAPSNTNIMVAMVALVFLIIAVLVYKSAKRGSSPY